jgi:hypothetical protein
MARTSKIPRQHRSNLFERLSATLDAILERQWHNIRRCGEISAEYLDSGFTAFIQILFFLVPAIFFAFVGSCGLEFLLRAQAHSYLIMALMYTVGAILLLFGGGVFIAILVAIAPFGSSREPESGRGTINQRNEFPYSFYTTLLIVDIAILVVLYSLTISYPHRFQSWPLKTFQHEMIAALSVGPDAMEATCSGYWPSIESKPVYSADGQRLSLWIESVCLGSERAFLNVATKGWDANDTGAIGPARGAFLIDTKGRRYDLQRDGGSYLRSLTNGFFFLPRHDIDGQAIYRFTLAFAPLSSEAEGFTLNHPQFARDPISFKTEAKVPPNPTPPALPSPPTSQLSIPEQLSPEEGTVFDVFPRTTTLKWQAVVGAAAYRVQIDYFGPLQQDDVTSGYGWASETGGQVIIHNVASTEYTFDFAGALRGRWRVWAVDSEGKDGLKTEWRTFVTRQ